MWVMLPIPKAPRGHKSLMLFEDFPEKIQQKIFTHLSITSLEGAVHDLILKVGVSLTAQMTSSYGSGIIRKYFLIHERAKYDKY